MSEVNRTRFEITPERHLRLGDFIRQNILQIVREWMSFAQTRTPASNAMSAAALRDHIEQLLIFIAEDLESPQTGIEQVQKSQGEGPKDGGTEDSAAELHGAQRLDDGFNIDQMVSEYRALRASVVKLWRARDQGFDSRDFDDLTRFNEAIDQAITESLGNYTKTLERSRNLFLGIMTHDLRNPIGAALMTSELMVNRGTLDARQTTSALRIKHSTGRAIRVLNDLLDITRVQFGSELDLAKVRLDAATLCKHLVDEMQAFYPGRIVTLETLGNMDVDWDESRMGQVLSNLIGNAIAHGFHDTPVKVVVEGQPREIMLSVRNEGIPIPREKIKTMFDSLIRGEEDKQERPGSTHLGLGLYISKMIVESHSGTLSATSSERDGTVFTARLPRC